MRRALRSVIAELPGAVGAAAFGTVALRRGTAVAMAAVLLGLAAVAGAASDKGAEGFWYGPLKAGPIELRLGFAIAKAPDGTLRGVMDSLDQGVLDIPMDEVKVSDRAVSFAIKQLTISYRGTLDADGRTITGIFTQGGATLPFTLQRAEKRVAIDRSQHPRKPYPYVEEEVSYKSGANTFAGTLTKPKGDGRFPVVLLITGSGAQDRDETILGHKPFLVLADHLTRKGIAVLRVDDRGVGGSSGVLTDAGIEEQADDVLAGVAYLKSRKDVRADRIGLIGHSEGGMVAPLAASRSSDVVFIVLLAAPGVTGEEVLIRQFEDVAKADPKVSAGDLVKARDRQRSGFAIVKEGPDADTIRKRLLDLEAAELAKLSDAERQAYQGFKAQASHQLEISLTPWFRSFVRYNPHPVLAKVAVPVLALNGDKDVQVAAKDNLDAIAKALREGGNKDVTVKALAGLNHLFQHAQTGALAEYGQIEETFAPKALEEISAWLLARVGRR
jgi:pimeloyl-ACP methyl ester carboxylesterase